MIAQSTLYVCQSSSERHAILKTISPRCPHILILSVRELLEALEVFEAQQDVFENDRTVEILTNFPVPPDIIALKFFAKERRQDI